MSGLFVRAGRRLRVAIGGVTLTALLALAAPAVASACIEDGGGQDQPPTIGFAQMAPYTLGYHGGTVVVSGEVADDCGLTSVHGDVVGEEQQVEFFAMEPAEPGSLPGGTIYRHELTLPANYTESPVHYVAVMEAEDTSFQVEHAFAGETEVEAAPTFDEPPFVSNAAIAPRTLAEAGGPVTISADAFDNRSVSTVFAIVTLPGGSQQEVTMEPVSADHFEGTFTAPANLGATPQEYTAAVYAEDDIGQTGSEGAGAFTVAPLVAPTTGELIVRRPDVRFFGRVRLGQASTRRIVVHDRGRRGSAPIAASISVSRAPFTIQGAVDGQIEFLLAAKETRTFTLEFAPTAAGLFDGSAVVSRADGAQPSVSVALSGVGLEPRRPKPWVNHHRRRGRP
jgi:hypothetical protein